MDLQIELFVPEMFGRRIGIVCFWICLHFREKLARDSDRFGLGIDSRNFENLGIVFGILLSLDMYIYFSV